ncbi:MAG: alternative ribosome rescue aminoacyl-tRNA hydrolase ArfB [Pseudomonadota bacterium]
MTVLFTLAPDIVITDDDVEIHATRAGGPGGQHVNKTSSAITLRFNVHRAPLPIAVRDRLLALADQRLTRDGDIVIRAERSRSQVDNRAAAIERLRDLIAAATVVPKKRKRTRPSLAAKRERLNDKRQRGSRKQLRRRPSADGTD